MASLIAKLPFGYRADAEWSPEFAGCLQIAHNSGTSMAEI